mgnify:CR=1 FL=1
MSEMNDSVSVSPDMQSGLWPQLRRVLRVARIVLYLLWGFVLAFLLGAFWSPYRPVVLAAKQRWCRHFLRILGVELTVTGNAVDAPVFLVSNHVSWLDIPLIASQRHLYFLSKAEVGDWPLIGTLARAMGTLFIKRGSGESSRKAREIGDRLKQGHTVLVFPEGTTTDGTGLRRFFPQLFDAPLMANVPVQPWRCATWTTEAPRMPPWPLSATTNSTTTCGPCYCATASACACISANRYRHKARIGRRCVRVRGGRWRSS